MDFVKADYLGKGEKITRRFLGMLEFIVMLSEKALRHEKALKNRSKN